MFSLDSRIRGIPANREQVLSFFQSINTPYVAIPGKQAGPTHAYIVGLRSQAGLNALVYLYMAEANDCAVYTCDRRNVGPEQFESLEQEAIGFVESMGFMMDNMNFPTLGGNEQDEMMRTLPVFMKDPSAMRALIPAPPASPAPAPSTNGGASPAAPKDNGASAVQLGRIFSAF